MIVCYVQIANIFWKIGLAYGWYEQYDTFAAVRHYNESSKAAIRSLCMFMSICPAICEQKHKFHRFPKSHVYNSLGATNITTNKIMFTIRILRILFIYRYNIKRNDFG